MQVPGSAAPHRRKVAWIASCAAVLLLLAGLALALASHALLYSASGVAMVLRAAAALSGVDIRFDGTSGRLVDGFGLEHLEIQTGHSRVVIRNLQARMGHWTLRPLRIAFESIRASAVEVHNGASQPGRSVPHRIALAVPWQVGDLQIDAFDYWNAPDSTDSTASRLQLRSIRAALVSSPDGYRLSAGRLKTNEVELEIEAALGPQWPFPVDANGTVRSRLADHPVQAHITASGSLDQLDLSARLEGLDAGGRLQAHLTSFAAPYLTEVRGDLQGIDPAHWKAGAPDAQLDVRVDLRPVPGRASALTGAFDAINHAEGPLDAQRLPMRSLRGTLMADFNGASGASIELPTAEAELGQGRATGRIEIATRDGVAHWSVDAELRRVDLAKVHSRVRPLRVDGTIHLENRSIDASAGFAARAHLRAKDPMAAELALDLQGDAQRLRLTSAHLALSAGTFDAQGLFERRTDHLQLQGEARALDVGLLLKALRSRIDGRFDIDATLGPQSQPQGVGRFELARSSICWPANRCWPVQGQGAVELSAGNSLHADVELALYSARLRAHGALNGAQGRVEIELTAAQLADFDTTLHGAVRAHATLSGAWNAPEVDLHAHCDGLRASGQAVASVSVDLHGKAQRGAPFDLSGAVEALGPDSGAEPWLQVGSLRVQGTPAEHTLSLQATLKGQRHALVFARGGLTAEGWSGTLVQASLDGPQPLRLSEPAPLAADAEAFSIGPAALEAAGASVRDAFFQYRSRTPRTLLTRGRFDDLRPLRAAPLAAVTFDSAEDPLRLRGHWDLTLGQSASGLIAIDLQSGDLRPSLGASAALPLGLRELSALIRLDDGEVQAQLSMDSERAGHVKADVRAALRRASDGGWSLARTQPWHAEVAAELPAIEAMEAFLPQRLRANLRLAGRLGASLRIDGTPERPQSSGTIEADQLRLSWIDQGIHLEQGRLRARLEHDRIQIDELRFQGPLRVAPADRRARDALRGSPVGGISAHGQLGLTDLTGSLQIQAQQLPVLQRPDRWLVVSGSGNAELAARQVRLNATLTADAGFLDLSRPDLPTLSDDVHVIQPSQPSRAPAPAASAASAASGVAIGLDLGIELGSSFYLRGNGLDARITGPLRLQGDGQGPLRVNGAVSVEQGTYEGFGQHLAIRYGRVNFQGAADNPGLDVLAVRTDLPVEVGITVTGSVIRPIVRLHSDPPLPDYEALSWLALGRPPSDPRTDNVALARLAAGLLSGSGEGIPTRLARMIGIDEINLRSADEPPGGTLLPRQSVAGKLTPDDTTATANASATNQIISLGHRINDVITVSYQQAISGASNVVQVSYQLSRHLSLIGRAGSDNALNLVFSLPFD